MEKQRQFNIAKIRTENRCSFKEAEERINTTTQYPQHNTNKRTHREVLLGQNIETEPETTTQNNAIQPRVSDIQEFGKLSTMINTIRALLNDTTDMKNPGNTDEVLIKIIEILNQGKHDENTAN